MASSGDQNAGGPRYAPDDPTLPSPWKGLIDGASGVLYYWNPDTNLTQYEKPPTSQPPPPSQAAGGEQQSQIYQSTTTSSYQTPQQQHQSTQVVVSQQNNNNPAVSAQAAQQQYMQQQYPQQQQQGMMPNHHHQYTQQGQQMQYYQGGGGGGPPPHQQRPYMMGGYHHQQQQQQPPNNNNSYPPSQGGGGGQQQQTPPAIIITQQQQPPQEQQQQHNRGEETPQGNKKTGGSFSPSQGHYSATSYQNQPSSSSSVQMQHQQMTTSSGQSPSPLSQNRNDQQGPPRFHNQFDPGMMLHVHQSHASPVNPNLSHDSANLPRRSAANDHYFAPPHTSNGPPQQQQHHLQPKLATIPMPKNPQDMRFSGAPVQNATPGFASGPNSGPVQGLHNVYGPPAGVPGFANSSMMRPSMVGMDSTAGMNISQTDMYRQKHEVTVTGGDIPAPFMSFDDTGFPPELLSELRLAGFASPTPIQAQTWPIALQNRDIVAIAKTGSGKTLGYLVPAFMLLRHRRNNPRNGPTVLVLSPTRELATQIQLEAIKFGQSSRVSCTCLYGGASKAMQLRELEQGADIVVATPGRLNDILESRQIDLRQVSLLVLDEADRMLDMGFEPQIRKVVNEIPPRRQTLMYTATWPKEVIKIANDLLVNPVQVNIGNVDELAANKSITQIIEMVPHMQKQRRLEQILDNQERGSKVIIFCSTKRLCDQITRTIERRGAAAIHGDKSQGERDYVLNQFRSGKSPILVATDVAARGLDIKDIRVVINYDFPTGVEDYVHRIGRTGRAGATGVAYTFFSDQDWKHAPELVKVLEGANQKVPPEIRELAIRGGPSFGRDRDGPNRFESGGGRWDSGGRGGAGDGGFGGRGGMRDGGFGGRGDGGFGGRGGMRDGGFGGRNGMRDGGRGGGMRDGGFGGRDGSRDGGFGGRGGGMRDGGFRGRGGGRDGGFVSRGGGRDGGFAGRGGMRDSGFGGRGDRDRYNNMDSRGGRGRGGGGRFDSRRDVSSRSRGRSFSPSPERVRTWGRDRSRSRSRSWSRSRSRSKSWSRSRSPRRSYSRSRSRSRSFERPRRVRQSKFDQMEPSLPGFGAPPPQAAPVQPSGDGVLSNTQFTPHVDNVEAVGRSEAIATVLSVDPAPET